MRTPLPANPYLTFAVGGSLALQFLALIMPGLRGLLPLVVNEGTKGHGQRQLTHTMVAGETPRRSHR